MSVKNIGGPGAVGYGPVPNTDQTTATVRMGEHTISDVAGRLGVDVSTLMKANNIQDSHQKLSVGQELNLPPNQAVISPRDASTGLPTGKRMHKPISVTSESSLPSNFGGDIKLSAAHLPQLQGGVSGSTPAANKSAKFEHSKKFSKAFDEVAWKQDLPNQGILSKQPQDALPLEQKTAADGSLDAGIYFKYDIKSSKQG